MEEHVFVRDDRKDGQFCLYCTKEWTEHELKTEAVANEVVCLAVVDDGACNAVAELVGFGTMGGSDRMKLIHTYRCTNDHIATIYTDITEEIRRAGRTD